MKRSGFLQRRTPLRAKTGFKRSVPGARTPVTRHKAPGRAKGIKVAVWRTPHADTLFSRYIRYRDKCCLRCRTTDGLTCSHFWGRGHSSTRFDPENCIALCGMCHSEWEHLKNNDYKLFMIKWLGQEKYDALEKKARSYKNRAEAVAECKAYLSSL